MLQWVLVLAALAGWLWLAGLAFMGYLQMPQPRTRSTASRRAHAVARRGQSRGRARSVAAAVRVSARGKARSVDRRLRSAIREVTEKLVVEPVEAEVEAYKATRSGIAAALR